MDAGFRKLIFVDSSFVLALSSTATVISADFTSAQDGVRDQGLSRWLAQGCPYCFCVNRSSINLLCLF